MREKGLLKSEMFLEWFNLLTKIFVFKKSFCLSTIQIIDMFYEHNYFIFKIKLCNERAIINDFSDSIV